MWWFAPVSPATQEGEVRGLQLKASLGKVSTRPYLKNKLKIKKILNRTQVLWTQLHKGFDFFYSSPRIE
jgi:hypothetical protein